MNVTPRPIETSEAHENGVTMMLPPELVRCVDKVRDPLIPRAAFGRHLLDKQLKGIEAKR